MYGTLEILEPDGDQVTFELTKEVVTIGRAAECEITLADKEASRQHTQIRCQEGGCALVDLGSANGTTIRGQRLQPNQAVALKDKMVFVVGRTRVRYLAPKPARAPKAEKSAADRPPPAEGKKPPPRPRTRRRAAPPLPPPPPPPTRIEKAPGPAEPPLPLGFPSEISTFLEHLPSVYASNDFIGRFLLIFERLLLPIDRQIDHLDSLFDPRYSPPELLHWLAGWVNLVLDETWPEQKRRQLIRSAVKLYQWRGTARGLKEYLRIYTGVTPEIFEPITRIDLDEPLDARGREAARSFIVTLRVKDPKAIDHSKVTAIIEAEKPAHSAYQLRVEKK